MISMRSYLPDDFTDVKEILEEAEHFDEVWDSEENLKSILQKEPESIIVAVDGERVIGAVYIIFFGANVAWGLSSGS